MAGAARRPAWECWGKAYPSADCPAHALLCHLLDVAAVAERLLTTHAPRALRQRMLGMIPNAEDASLRLLLFLIALHDLGKYTPAFQSKLDWARPLLLAAGFDLAPPATARPHGAAGYDFIKEALVGVAVPPAAARSLARAVTAHHGEFPTNDLLYRRRMGSSECGRHPRWQVARGDAIGELRACLGVEAVPAVTVDHAAVMRLAGLTSVADWIGSMDEVFRYEPPQPSAESYWPLARERAAEALARVGMRRIPETAERNFTSLFPALSPWPLHVATEEIGRSLSSPSLIIVEAPMGEGKTEAALLLAHASACRLGEHGFYIGLPTQATANQMFGRVKTFLEATGVADESTLVLAHAEAHGIEALRSIVEIYDDDSKRLGRVRAEEWFLPKKRALLAEHGVGTIDQALLGVLRTRHGFVRLFGLAGKTVVLDEVHAYDTFTSTILDRLLEWLAALGTTVVLLSATLPRMRRGQLTAAYHRGLGGTATEPVVAEDVRYPRITTIGIDRRSATHVESRASSMSIDIGRIEPDVETIARLLIEELRDGGCVGWICNTVDRAQTACKEMQKLAPDIPRLLIHARMLREHRNRCEGRLEEALGSQARGAQRPARLLVIGTQVLEQSLDVDFDLLVTDLAPVDLVLQRAGRLHRHRDRTNRSGAHLTPRLWIAYSAGSAEEISIRTVAAVYSEAMVRATVRALAGRTAVALPEDIEPLVEEVYRDIPPPEDGLHEAYVEHSGGSYAQRQIAQMKVIPGPTDEDDIFGSLRMPYSDDEDPVMHEMLRATTRDAELSVQAVCLVGRDGRVFASEESNQPLDLTHAPERHLAKQLVERTITVSRQSLVSLLLKGDTYQPAGWKDLPLLRHRRALIFTDGVAIVGGDRLRLHPELGLVFEKANATPGT